MASEGIHPILAFPGKWMYLGNKLYIDSNIESNIEIETRGLANGFGKYGIIKEV